jgi:outer membrane protein assembly factor BamB
MGFTRLLSLAALAGLAAGAVAPAAVRRAGSFAPDEQTAAAPVHSAADVPERSFRIAWRTMAGGGGSPENGVTDLELADGRLYYVCSSEVGALDARTGNRLWRQSLLPPSVPPERVWEFRAQWQMALTGQRLFVSRAETWGPPDAGPAIAHAFDAATGKPLWKRSLAERPYGRPAPAGDVVLIGGFYGDVTALRQADGSVAWHRQLARSRGDRGTQTALHVRAEGDYAAALIGGGRVVGFRAQDGKILWEYLDPGPYGEVGASEGFAIAGGTVYVLLDQARLAAFDLRTGRRRWQRGPATGSGTPSMATFVAGRAVIAGMPWRDFWTTVAVDRASGKTLWHASPEGRFSLLPPADADDSHPLLYQGTEPRYVGNPRARSLAAPEVRELLALDARTGALEWRSRSLDSIRAERALSDGDRLLVTDGPELFSLVPGRPAPLTADAAERHKLAKEAVHVLFDWPYVPFAPGEKVRYPASDTRAAEARLALVALGGAGVEAIMDYLRARIARDERNPPPAPGRGFPHARGRRSSGSAFDILVDQNDPAVVPELAGWCDRLRNRESRDEVAEALIHFGDVRAGGALFRYAQSPEAEPVVRRDAL